MHNPREAIHDAIIQSEREWDLKVLPPPPSFSHPLKIVTHLSRCTKLGDYGRQAWYVVLN
jgi:hypothetical protein